MLSFREGNEIELAVVRHSSIDLGSIKDLLTHAGTCF